MTQQNQNFWENKGIDWKNPDFSWKKAHIASIIAGIAYEHISEYELENIDRVNLIPWPIPCKRHRDIIRERYQDIIQGTRVFNIPNMVSELLGVEIGEENYLIIENRYFVAVVLEIQDVLFISFRGTNPKSCDDWRVNFDVYQSRLFPNINLDISLHKGYYSTVINSLYEIRSQIRSKFGKGNKDNINIRAVTGHSLGGALASVFHILLGDCSKIIHEQFFAIARNVYHKFHYPPYRDLYITSCYTFGMPRYGNLHAVNSLENPYHIYNQDDWIPLLPPKFIGFEDNIIEYCLTPEVKIEKNNLKGFFLWKLIDNLFKGKGAIKEHGMEEYIFRLETKAR